MLSLALIRENPDAMRKALADRHTEAPLDEILDSDGHWRRLLQEVESLRAERNAAGKEMGQLNRAARPPPSTSRRWLATTTSWSACGRSASASTSWKKSCARWRSG